MCDEKEFWNFAAPARVLLVGDDDEFIHELSDLLESQGHQVHAATTTRMALFDVRYSPCDVVVVDLGATGFQGVEVALSLRALKGLAPPVIAISAMPNVEQHCRSLGITWHVAPPFRVATLLERIEQARRPADAVETTSGIWSRETVPAPDGYERQAILTAAAD